jgi:hypothetical protein
MKLAVHVAAVIGLFAGLALAYLGLHPQVHADVQVKGPMWEYKVVAFRGARDAKVIEHETQKLNELANEGWEYVGPISNYSKTFGSGDVESYGFVAFRRPKK